MTATALYLAFAAVVLAMFMNLGRQRVGPDPEDRVIALDTLYINALALILVISMYFESRLYFEAALLIAMMGFVATLALGKYLERGDLVD